MTLSALNVAAPLTGAPKPGAPNPGASKPAAPAAVASASASAAPLAPAHPVGDTLSTTATPTPTHTATPTATATPTTTPKTTTTPAPAPTTHADAQLTARDGQPIAYRTTVPAGAPKAIVVMQQGTYGKPAFFDGMGEALARQGVLSYAVGSRVETSDPSIHADDLARVVAQARQDHPGVPVRVMGVSLGSAIVMDWNARHNPDKLPVVLMSPVVVPRYLGLGDLLKVAGGLFSRRVAKAPVHSPMSAHKALTTNPASPEARLADPDGMKVPARLFGDVLKMTVQQAWHGRQTTGPVYVAMAGDDQVATNWSTKAFMKLVGSHDETTRVFPGRAHDLSQEWQDPALVGAIAGFVLPK